MSLIIKYAYRTHKTTTVHIYNIHINQTDSNIWSEPNPGFIGNATWNMGQWNNEEFRIQTPIGIFEAWYGVILPNSTTNPESSRTRVEGKEVIQRRPSGKSSTGDINFWANSINNIKRSLPFKTKPKMHLPNGSNRNLQLNQLRSILS